MENDELADYLAALQREECYRVDAVIKESAFEITQQVSFIGANGSERGPYIRKYIKREAGMGAVYERLYAAEQAGRRFKHLPRILECYSREDYLAVVMEYVRGETLHDLVYRADPSVQLAIDVFPQLCDAVCELHEDFNPPIIHRDLKPSNVILSDGALTLIDFGIAREFKDGEAVDTTHFGTRSYAPPEQFGYGQTTIRSDVYALGMMLYYCLTETVPDVSNRGDWYVNRRIPIELRGVIAKATAFDPMQRYASVCELKADFLQAVEKSSAQAAPSASQEQGKAHEQTASFATQAQAQGKGPAQAASSASQEQGKMHEQTPSVSESAAAAAAAAVAAAAAAFAEKSRSQAQPQSQPQSEPTRSAVPPSIDIPSVAARMRAAFFPASQPHVLYEKDDPEQDHFSWRNVAIGS